MALTWNIESCDNYKELTDGDAWQITNALIWLTMAIGIWELKADNADEFYARLKLLEALNGTYLSKDGKGYKITKEDVTRRIGLRTNAAAITRPAFNKRRLEIFYRELGVAK